MRLKVAAISDRGAIRAKNEDNMFVDGSLLPEVHNDRMEVCRELSLKQRALCGVFDGMGGFSAGETASWLSAEAALQVWTPQARRSEPKEILLEICERANQAVVDEMKRRDNILMGATAAMLLFESKQYHLCNVGDSPIFLLREGMLLELSAEHTERAAYEAITGKKADPKRKFGLTQNIGMSDDDLVLEPHYASDRLNAGDVFLICSDGVTDMLEREELAKLLTLPDEKTAAETIVDRALEAGGRDNITVIVLRCSKEPGILDLLGGVGKRKGDMNSGT